MLLMINVDDISGEVVPHTIDGLMERGAKSVHVVPAITKKGRPEFIIFVDAPEHLTRDLTTYLASELGTLGVRIIDHRHLSIPYRKMDVLVECPAAGLAEPVRVGVKCFEDEQGLTLRAKAECEDIMAALAALGRAGAHLSFQGLKSLVEMVAQSGQKGSLGDVTVLVGNSSS